LVLSLALIDLHTLDFPISLGQNALGVPQLSGTGAPAVISDGIFCLGKNQTEIPKLSQSIEKTPPPLLLNAAPKELV